MSNVDVVDSHVHFWDPGRITYPWLESVPALSAPHGPTEYPASVAAAVFVECDADPAMAGDEVTFVEELAESNGPVPIAAVVAHAPLELGDGARQTIEGLAARPLVRGVRRLLQDEEDPRFCLRDSFVEGVGALSGSGLSMDLCVRHHQLPGVIELVRRSPDVRFVLDHAGKPDIRGQTLGPWRDHIRGLSEMENVWCKLSGLVTEADPVGWTVEDLRPYVEHVIDCFGFDRILYGSDWPVVDLAGGHASWFAALTELVSGCSEDERARLWGSNARAFYRIGSG